MVTGRSGFQKPPQPGLRESTFFRASSYSHRVSSRSESSRHSIERQPIPTTKSQESLINRKGTLDLTQNIPNNEKEQVTEATASQGLTQKMNELDKPNEQSTQFRDNVEQNKEQPLDLTVQEVKGEENEPNESVSVLRLNHEADLKESPGTNETEVATPPVLNNNSSASARAVPKRRRMKKNRNDSCSVKVPPLVHESMIVPISPFVVPPIPPLVLAATMLTELPDEEPTENATNNANEFNDLLAIK